MPAAIDKINKRLGILSEDEQNKAEIAKLTATGKKLWGIRNSLLSRGYDEQSPEFTANMEKMIAVFDRLQMLESADGDAEAEGGSDDVQEPATHHHKAEKTDFKDPHAQSYDRLEAENALYHTIGPLMEKPRWADKWDSGTPSAPTPPLYFNPGGEAPTWTPEEIVYAYAGDPSLLGRWQQDNPKSPEYPARWPSPLYRMAKKVARQGGRPNDQEFISNNYSNGFVPLARLLKPGYDEGRVNIISYLDQYVKGATMAGGGGGTAQTIKAGADLNRVLKSKDPKEILNYTNAIGEKFRNESLWDKNNANPYGPYSPEFYDYVSEYARALGSGVEENIDNARAKIYDLQEKIKDDTVFILGATTGAQQAVSTKNREINSASAVSIDKPTGDGKGTFGDTITGSSPDPAVVSDGIGSSMVNYVLDLAINHSVVEIAQDQAELTGQLDPEDEVMTKAADMGAKMSKQGTVPAATGRMSANEFRYLLRALGPIASDYPGKGTVRKNTSIPRDAPKWWEPGSDPEIEPIPDSPDGAMWKSIWSRDGYPAMVKSHGKGEDGYAVLMNGIAQEMTAEVKEFKKLNIPTRRTVTEKKDKRTGEMVGWATSPNAVTAALKSARIKFQLISQYEKDDLEKLDESKSRNTLIEELVKLDAVDFELVKETARFIVSKLVFEEDIKPTGIDFTPILKENRISQSEISNLLNKLNTSEQDVLNLLNKFGSNFRDPSNLPQVIKSVVADIAENYGGYAADLDINKLSDLISHIWQNRPNIQHTAGGRSGSQSDDDDMPMLGKDIQSRFSKP